MKENNSFSRLNFFNLILLFLIIQSIAFSQRSRIEGVVKDAETGEPLFGANVVVLNTNSGAATDINGNYFIINIPVGTYELKASMLGYANKTVVDVIVSQDRITKIDFELTSTAIEQEEVVVTAERNLLNKEVAGTQLVVTDEQIESVAGIQDLENFIELQPGVSLENGFLSIRGGSADQTGTFVNGLAYNNAAVGNSETTLPLSAIDQVSVSAGGFNAEYGNFRSGLINISTKSGARDKYHGTISVTGNIPHLKRFGPTLTDPYGPALRPYLDPGVAFIGTNEAWGDDSYLLGQYDQFNGWINLAELFNSQNPAVQATPYDYYLLGAWMHMTEPDYAGLEALSPEMKQQIGYEPLTEEQRELFREHRREEEGMDYNIDIGFGGPLPFVGKYLGDATFYLSHLTRERYYIAPVTKKSDNTYVTMASIKSNPLSNITINMDLLWKRQLGISPIKPAFGDFPDATREGGFMRENNLNQFTELKDLDNGTNYMFDPMIFPELHQTTIVSGLKINHAINSSTYWEATFGYSSIKDHSPTGDNRDNTVLTVFGPFPVSEMPYGKLQYAPNNRLTAIIGTDTITYQYPGNDAFPSVARRFRSKEGDLFTNVHIQQYRAKADLVTQVGLHNYIKAGIEYNLYDIDHRMWHKWNTNAYNTYEYNYHRFPSQTGLYIQDQVSYEGVVATLGTRFDYYYGGGGKWPTGDPYSQDGFYNIPFGEIPAGSAADSFYQILSSGRSLIWEYWEEYDKQNPGFLQPIKNHFIISPRIGIAFPITENSKFYFNYGHFRSQPPYFTMYLIQYRYTKDKLYEMSNPNLEPPRTISYELGVSYNPFGNVVLNISGYYKDVSGEAGDIDLQSLRNVAYDSYANNKYEDIIGTELNISKNDNSWLNGWINLDYRLKKSGNTGRAELLEGDFTDDPSLYYSGNEDRFLPQPRLTSNIVISTKEDWFSNNLVRNILSNWYLSVFAEWEAGEYLTWPEDVPYLSNNHQWPDYYMVDMRLSKVFNIAGFNTTFFVDVKNVFNIKVNLLSEDYAFANDNDKEAYLNSLRFDQGDKPGDLRSAEKPYINDPNYSYFLYGFPRDIWFGVKVDF